MQCTNIWTFLILFGICYCIETLTNTYLNASIQSIERQFQIPSRLSGGIVSVNRLGYLTTIIFLAYFASRARRRNRWIGGGCLLSAVACLLIASSHFVHEKQNAGHRSRDVGKMVLANLTAKELKSFKAASFGAAGNGRPSAGGFDALKKLLSNATQNASSGIEMEVPTTPNPLELMKAKLLQAAASNISYCNSLVNKVMWMLREQNCNSAGEFTSAIPLGIIFIGVFLTGVGHSLPHTIGIPLVDDMVQRRNSPILFGGIYSMKIFGPLAGFLIGGAFSGIYYTLSTPMALTIHDPRWIGAWWLGYACIGTALVIPAILLFFFPITKLLKHLDQVYRGPDYRRNSRRFSEAKASINGINGKNDDPHEELLVDGKRSTVPTAALVVAAKKRSSSLLKQLVELKAVMFTLAVNPIFMASLVSRTMETLGSRGYRSFLPKFLDNHYGMPIAQASKFIGPGNVGSVITGVIVGSLLMKKFNLDGRRAIGVVVFSSLASLLVTVLKATLRCQSIVSRVGQLISEGDYNFSLSCNANCGCSTNGLLYPVCSETGDAFYSPCHAGCSSLSFTKGKGLTESANCSCADGKSVSRQFCVDDCQIPLIAFLVLCVLDGFVVGIGIVPGVLVVIRSVAKVNRAIALGFVGFAGGILGSFPSPMIYGSIIDTACLQWGNNCGSNGNCEIYNSDGLRLGLHVFFIATKTCCVICDLIVLYFAKDLLLLKEETQRNANGAASELKESPKFRVTACDL